MTKQTGFFINVKFWLPIDKANFAAQAAAYAQIAEITEKKALPEGFAAEVLSVAVKQGSKDGDAVVVAPVVADEIAAAAVVEGAEPVAETETATGRRLRT